MTASLHDRVEQEVGDVVGQRAADEELHREVVDPLGVLAVVGLLGAQPALREDVAHGAGDASKRSRGPAAVRSMTLSKSRCRSYSALAVPVNWTGPHPYCSLSLVKSTDPLGLLDTRFSCVGVSIPSSFV